jgi:putative YhbY family RNA-binding protein
MLELTSAIRRELKSLAHHLEPVVIIGDAGLTPAVLREVDVHLRKHELIKVRVAGDDRDARAQMINTMCETHDAAPVQQIGKILVIYRPKPAEPEKKQAATTQKPSARKSKRPQRKTKRAYQR